MAEDPQIPLISFRPSEDPPWFTAGKNTPATHIRNVRKGLHPLGFALLGKAGARCGNCENLYRRLWIRGYIKCRKTIATHGPGTDVRKKWAACEHWKEAQPQ